MKTTNSLALIEWSNSHPSTLLNFLLLVVDGRGTSRLSVHPCLGGIRHGDPPCRGFMDLQLYREGGQARAIQVKDSEP